MKLIMVSLMLFFYVHAHANNIKWMLLHGYVDKDNTVYIEEGSIYNKDENVKIGRILVVPKKLTKAPIDSYNNAVRSKVSTVMIDCETSMAAPMIDLYFAEAMPKKVNKPVGIEVHSAVIESFIVLGKDSALYNIFCSKIL